MAEAGHPARGDHRAPGNNQLREQNPSLRHISIVLTDYLAGLAPSHENGPEDTPPARSHHSVQPQLTAWPDGTKTRSKRPYEDA
jgi:hypothetical protein